MREKENLPNFLIVGATRAGTTSLYHYLSQHPDIFMSEIKEPCFFAFADEHPTFKKGKSSFVTDYESYINLFKEGKDYKCRGEASTPYLYFYEKAINNIRKYIPEYENLKIIIILRNPIERAYSQYMLLRKELRENLSFEDAIKVERLRIKENYHFDYFYISRGYYFKAVEAYLKNFKNVRVYLFEDFKNDPEAIIKDIFKFLGVNENFKCDIKVKYNVSGIPKMKWVSLLLNTNNVMKNFVKRILPIPLRNNIKRSIIAFNLKRPKMPDRAKKYLIDLYREDIINVSKLIHRDLSGWLV